MKAISLPITELRPALAGLGKVISRRTTLPVLGSVRLRRHDSGQLDLTVTDLDRSATFTLDSHDKGEPTTVLVPYADLANIAKSCGPSDIVTMEAADDHIVTLRFPVAGQTIEHHCERLPPEQFPDLPDIPGKNLPLNDNLRQAINDAMECASSDPARVILNGAQLDVSSSEGHYVVGTDGRHLFSSNSFKLPLAQSVLIPAHKFLGWKGFNSDGDWRLKVAPATKDEATVVEIASDHWRFTARSVDGTYPNWKQVLPDPAAYQTTISIHAEAVEEVMQAAQRLPTPDSTHHEIGLEAGDHGLRLLGRSKADAVWTKVHIREAGIAGPAVTILLNRLMLLKALRFGLTRIQVIDAISPLRFCMGGRQMIVMPLRSQPDPVPTAPTPPVPTTLPAAASPEAAMSSPSTLQPMQTTTTNTHAEGAPRSSTTTLTAMPESRPALETALAQVENLKSGLRDSIGGLSRLSDTLRQALREQKAGDKDLQSVRSTLRSLQNVKL